MAMGISIDILLRKALLLGFLILVSASTNSPLRAAESSASIIVAYVQGTTPQDITSIEEKFGLKLTKTLAAANSRVYDAPAKTPIEQLLRDLGKESAVRYAEIDQEVNVKEK
jgi:hypothetical protein